MIYSLQLKYPVTLSCSFLLSSTLITFLLIQLSPQVYSSLAPEVSLKWGKVRGFVHHVGRKPINTFLGIPYVEPPIGQNRFRRAKPFHTFWNVTFDATNYGPACPEPYTGNDLKRAGKLIVRSENCLFLNIWVPQSTKSRSSSHQDLKGLPVMVYAHGGGLVMLSAGDNKFMNGAQLSATGKIIIVTFNFRLGALGWLYCDPVDVPGNMGLHDTLAAIRWVHSNIAAFGGDPNRITVSGLSSGSSMMSALFLGGHLNKYISGIMLHSGVASPLFSEPVRSALRRCEFISQATGCRKSHQPVDSSVIDCLRTIPPVQLVAVQTAMALNEKHWGTKRAEVFLLTVGESLFPSNMSALAAQKKWPKGIPMIVSHVPDEASVVEHNFPRPKKQNMKTLRDYFYHFSPTFVPHYQYPDLLAEDLTKTYLAGYSESPDLAEPYVRTALGDCFITCPSLWFADQVAQTNPVWSSLFTYTFSPGHKNLPALVSGSTHGTRHGAEIWFYFGVPYYQRRGYDDNDRQMASVAMLIWSQFVRTGTAFWTPYQVTSTGRVIPYQKELNVDKINGVTQINSDRYRCFIWDDIIY